MTASVRSPAQRCWWCLWWR